jgi:hypothetical protein
MQDISYRVAVDDLDAKIDATITTDTARSPVRDFTFTEYHDTSVIYRQLEEWADKYPGLVSISSIGKTAHEKQEIKLLTISDASSVAQQKPAIFIDGGEVLGISIYMKKVYPPLIFFSSHFLIISAKPSFSFHLFSSLSGWL